MQNTCFHCGLKTSVANTIQANINNIKQNFCCIGCKSVCQTIYESGLDSFYKQQQNSILPRTELEYPLEFYDSDAFQEPFLSANNNNKKTITLISDTIHCIACVWLIEKAISAISGVEFVRVNFSNKRIQLTWDDKRVKLSHIMQKLSSLGYSAMPYESNIAEQKAIENNKKMLYRIGFSAFAMMNLLWISIALYTGAASGKYYQYFQYLSFALATPALFYSGFGFLKSAFLSVKNKYLNMDVPISIGALVTYFYSIYALSFGKEVYFDTVVNFIFVILIGRFLEGLSKKNAISASSSLEQLQPKVALVKNKNAEKITPVNNIKIGDIVLIKPGEKIPVDGVITFGQSEVNEAILTGESVLKPKKINSLVYAGTINTIGALEVKVSTTNQKNTLSQIKDLVTNANMHKSKIICTIDKIIPYFVFTTLFLALITFLYWQPKSFDFALLSAVSVLIITCPCAFGLAVPMSVAVSGSVLSNDKILLKNSDILEVLDKVKYVVFDKTGTLTLGCFQIKKIVSNIDNKKFINIVANIEYKSEHPIAKAIVKHKNSNLTVSNFKVVAGKGVVGAIDNCKYKVGSLAYVKVVDKSLIAQAFVLEQQGYSCIWCSGENKTIGFVALKDETKTDAKKVISTLKNMGKKLVVLSGDSQVVVENLSKKLGIPQSFAQMLPIDKLNYIKKIQKTDKVLMVGDGVNDAPALAAADASIAINSGSDISLANADVVIVKNTLNGVIKIFLQAKKTKKIIKQNIVFALTYNICMVPLAMMGFVDPLFAAIAMPISSLVVIGNAMRLKNKQL